ncbi:ABC transporter permease [Desulfosporosinus nitroreducens]|uniref:ABC transporter permease n=1 Tax=Desulfosporosinus nitroreducens TaxID=2018668 RepID=A0ABT8QPR8_9FIRM|nr:ABC transporter permease subunit [Desulfosporosinus nitroreducens]MDO0823341.1 ABC transporter permease [Desulfosporosinus nitroreducens]
MSGANVMVIAEKELLESMRSRWLVTFTIIFGLLALLISFFGLSGMGVGGYQGFNRVTASLLNLVLYLLPLIALVIGSSTIAGEKEVGSLHVLLTQPVSKSEVIIGKFLGLALALTASILAGFGSAGVVIAWKTGTINIVDYLVFVILSIVLTLVFLSMSLLISVVTTRRSQAVAIAIFVWFFTILVYDFLAIGIASLQQVTVVVPLLLTLLLLNPADMVRVLVILQLGGEETFGPTLAALTRMMGSGSGEVLLGVVLFLWLFGPLGLSVWIFSRKQDY